MGELFYLWLGGWVVAIAVMCFGWVLQRLSKNGAIVDVFWALGQLPIAWFYFSQRDGELSLAGALLLLLVTAWALRLGGFLFVTRVIPGEVEERYRVLTKKRKRPQLYLFFNFQLQAFLQSLMSLAILAGVVWSQSQNNTLLPVHWLGLVVFIVGLSVESLADAQLRRFRKNPANQGQQCDTGLWSWSRHPNYFGDFCAWLGMALLAYSPGNFITLVAFVSPLLNWVIFNLMTLPLTERITAYKRPDVFNAYASRVSKFWPRPPRPPQQ